MSSVCSDHPVTGLYLTVHFIDVFGMKQNKTKVLEDLRDMPLSCCTMVDTNNLKVSYVCIIFLTINLKYRSFFHVVSTFVA